MKGVLGGLVAWLLALYFFLTGLYAIRCPAEYLKASWTAKRGMSPTLSSRDIRGWGVIFLVYAAGFGAFGLWVLVNMLSKLKMP